MTFPCRACEAGLEHCHGVLIHHAYRRDECTEDDCVAGDTAHEMHIDCVGVGCECDNTARSASSGPRSAHRVG